MTPKEFKQILIGLDGVEIFHNEGMKKDGDYIVWQEIGANSMCANNTQVEKACRFSVDFFTKVEYSNIPTLIEKLFNENEISIVDYVVDYEKDTKITHYAYTVEA